MDAVGAQTMSREDFIHNLAKDNGVKKKQVWRNNNGTQSQHAYVIDVKNMKQVAKIISEIFAFNKASNLRPVVAVPVAGWSEKKACASFASKEKREHRLVEEYAKSFSLSPFTTAVNADVILRVSKKAQTMKIFERHNRRYFRVSAGVRITDAEKCLAASKLAFPPNFPTLQMASCAGAAANGCYGPGKNYMSMTSNIHEMKVISPSGQLLTLSAKQNPELFEVLRDCHMGSGFFVTEITFKNIERDFLMKRTDILLKNSAEFEAEMLGKKLLDKPHFIMHFIPVDMNEKGDHFPRFRITTFERTIEAPSAATQPKHHQDISDYINLTTTEIGEPVIHHIVDSEHLQPFFPLVLKAAAKQTFGHEPVRVEIDGSASTMHILRTYTDLALTDINWLIQVKDVPTATNLLVGLMKLVEKRLGALAEGHKHPLLTVYARFLKGLYYEPGKGGVAPTAVDHEGDYILSFELLTYVQLQKTEAFKDLLDEVIVHLTENNFKFKYHPGKTWPDHLYSLTQLFEDTIDRQRLFNFQNAIIQMHDGLSNISISPFLTPQKKVFIGLDNESTSEHLKEEKVHEKCPQLTSEQNQRVLKKIVELAKEQQQKELKSLAKNLSVI